MDALERLYRDRYLGFRNALARVVGSQDAAHDVVQEAFATALGARASLRAERSLAAWVWKIAYRIAIRTRADAVVVDLPLAHTDSMSPPDLALASALRELTPQRRLVVFLRYFADFSYAEIAEALDISVGTVSATLTQARAALADTLGSEEVGR